MLPLAVLIPMIMQGLGTAGTAASMYKQGGVQPSQTPPPNGQPSMTQDSLMTPMQAYPKQQPQMQKQNGSLLGNSLMYNPMIRRQYG